MVEEKGGVLPAVKISSAGAVPAETSIRLTDTQVLDLTGLNADQIAELKHQYVSGMIDVKKKAEELKVDVGALDAALSSFNDQTAKGTQLNASVTISHTQTSALGRTEVMIGNTEKAASGKISRSAAGLEDQSRWIIGAVVVVAVVIAFIVMSGK